MRGWNHFLILSFIKCPAMIEAPIKAAKRNTPANSNGKTYAVVSSIPMPETVLLFG